MSSPHKQSGWFLLEALLAMVIGCVVVCAATEYTFRVFSTLDCFNKTWEQLQQIEKWRLWMKDALDSKQAHLHCQSSGQVAISIIKQQLQLHSCRWVKQHWRWVDTQYFVKTKKGVPFLYEKTNGEPAVAWFSGVQALRLKVLPVKKAGAHLFAVDWVFWTLGSSPRASGSGLNTYFILAWQDEKKQRQ